MTQSKSLFGFASDIFNPLERLIFCGRYSDGPGVSFDRAITRSTSDIGLASDILHAEFRVTEIGVYCPGPGDSLDLFIIHSVSVFGFAMLKRPPPGLDQRPLAEQATAVLGRLFFLAAERAASRSRNEVSRALVGLFFVAGDKFFFFDLGVVLLDLGVVLLDLGVEP